MPIHELYAIRYGYHPGGHTDAETALGGDPSVCVEDVIINHAHYAIPGTVHRGLGSNLQSADGPAPNTHDGALPAQRKDHIPYQNHLHASGDDSLRRTVSVRLGAIG